MVMKVLGSIRTGSDFGMIGSISLILEQFLPHSPIKGCWGIVYTHGVWMGGWAGGGKKFVGAVSQKM